MRDCFKFLLLFISISSVSITSIASSRSIHNQDYYKRFQEVFELIDREYVNPIDKDKVLEESIAGMAKALDPHTIYYTSEDLEDFMSHMKGEFGGIGVEIMYENDMIKIISPIEGLPADKAGLIAGDCIISVDGESVGDLGFTKAVKKMRGEPNTQVKITVMRASADSIKEYELTREAVKMPSVKVGIESDIAYISMITFNENTITELRQGMNLLSSGGQKIKGIILDLRNNAGGSFDQAIAVTEYFVDSGLIVSTKGRRASSEVKYLADPLTVKAPKVPLVTLINGGSASASEIVAAAIQYHKCGILLGTKSFGKGSVQTLIPLSNSSAIKLTTAQYYTPSGRSIQAEGVTPDIIVSQAKVEYLTDKKFSESLLKNSLPNPHSKDDKAQPETTPASAVPAKAKKQQAQQQEIALTKKQISGKIDLEGKYLQDHQYSRALDLIKGIILTK